MFHEMELVNKEDKEPIIEEDLTTNVSQNYYSILEDKLKEYDYPLIHKATTTEALQTLLQREAPAAVLIVNHVEALARKHAELAEFISRAMEPIYTEDYYLMLSRQFYAKKPWLAEKIWEEQTLIVNELGAMLEEKYIQ